MMVRWIVSSAWVMGLMVSPEALALNGRLAGWNGWWFVLPLMAAAGIHWLSFRSMEKSARASHDAQDEISLLTGVYGDFGGALLLWLARPAAAVFLALATLVTSGFVFNETFLHWFPNFAFAVVLLIFVLGINLAGPRVAAVCQVGFLVAVVTGLLCLVIIAAFAGRPATGLSSFSSSLSSGLSSGLSTGPAAQGILPAALLFMGYDMLRYTFPAKNSHVHSGRMGMGILLAGGLFFLWNGVSVMFVAPERLAGSSIPHILTAKAIAGQAGRVLIGLVGIAGTCALVNLVFRANARMLADMAALDLLPRGLARHTDRPVIPLVAMAVLTALLMAAGLAGSEKLDLLIRTALLLWLFFYAMVHLAHWVTWRGKKKTVSSLPPTGLTGMHLFCFMAMTGIGLGLLAQHPQSSILVLMMLAIAAAAAAVAWIGLKWAHQRHSPLNNEKITPHFE